MSTRMPLLIAVFLGIAAFPVPAVAAPDFSFTVPVKITNLASGYSPYILCRVKEYTKSSPYSRVETAIRTQAFAPDASGNFDGDVKLDLTRSGTPSSKPDSVYTCTLNFITKANVPVPPNSAATLQVSGSIP